MKKETGQGKDHIEYKIEPHPFSLWVIKSYLCHTSITISA